MVVHEIAMDVWEITKLHIATAYHALSIVVVHLMRWFLVVHLMQLIVANCPWFGALKAKKALHQISNYYKNLISI